MYFCFLCYIKQFADKKIVCTMIGLIIAVAPHLGTVFSMMHVYAGLAMITIIAAYSISLINHIKPMAFAFLLWVVTAVLIDIHLIDSSIKSGRVGKNMAQEAIQKTGKPVKSVYVIIIEDDYPKLSSFCVIPNEAFGWGQAVRYETYYKWPEAIEDTTIERYADAIKNAKKLGLETLNKKQYDCVWIINH
jgi:uncharacterized protein YhhL (DUF1145 family)